MIHFKKISREFKGDQVIAFDQNVETGLVIERHTTVNVKGSTEFMVWDKSETLLFSTKDVKKLFDFLVSTTNLNK